MKFVVTFDLTDTEDNKRSEDYKELEKHLTSYSSNVKVTRNVYVIDTEDDISKVNSDLRAKLIKNDISFVAEIKNDYRTCNYKTVNESLKLFFDK